MCATSDHVHHATCSTTLHVGVRPTITILTAVTTQLGACSQRGSVSVLFFGQYYVLYDRVPLLSVFNDPQKQRHRKRAKEIVLFLNLTTCLFNRWQNETQQSVH